MIHKPENDVITKVNHWFDGVAPVSPLPRQSRPGKDPKRVKRYNRGY